MIKTPISLQDLRKRIYATAKADKHHRFWGLYVHLCKEETLKEAYRRARQNNGAPGIDGVTFEMIEEAGVEPFLARIQTGDDGDADQRQAQENEPVAGFDESENAQTGTEDGRQRGQGFEGELHGRKRRAALANAARG